jgi:hypothetical protein
MQPGEVRLSIDCGSVSAVAVLSWPGGRWIPVIFDDVPYLSAAVFVDQEGELVTGAAAWQRAPEYPERLVAAPVAQLREGRIGVAGRDVDPVDLVAAILRRVGDKASRVAQRPIGEVRLVVPAAWGPRRRTLMRQAAHRAGLGQPTLVEAPVAAAQRVVATGTSVLVGSYAVVCDFGGGFEASVVRRVPTGFEVLSTIEAADAGGNRIDQAIAEDLAAVGDSPAEDDTTDPLSDADRLMLLAAARTAKETLTHAATVAAGLPPPRPAVVLHSARVDALARPALFRAARATQEAIDVAEVDRSELAGVYCVGGAATPAAMRVLGDETGLTPVALDEPRMAAVLGAAEAISRAGTAADIDAPVSVPPAPRARRAAGLAVPGAASLILFLHFLFSAEPSSSRSRGYGDPYAYVLANWGELAMAATFALVTALMAATLIASSLPAERRPQAGERGELGEPVQQIGTGLLAAAAAGLAVAGMYAVAASVIFGLSTGPFLRWALLPILPLAAVAAVTAVLAARWGRIPREGWHAWLTFPVSSVACAGVGMVLVQMSMTAKVYPTYALANGLLGRFGALLLGVGAALALVRSARFRIIVAAPLATFMAAIVSWPATGLLGVMYIAAATVWWLQQVWRLLRLPGRGRVTGAAAAGTGPGRL